MGQSLIATNQVQSHGIQLSDDPYDKNRPLVIVDHDSDWYVPFNVKQYFAVVETRAPTIKEYNYCPNIIYITSYNRWDLSYIKLPHHSSVLGYLKCNHPEKYTDNFEYDVLTGSISSILLQDLQKFYRMRRLQS